MNHIDMAKIQFKKYRQISMRHIMALILLSLPIWSCKVKKPAENVAIVSAHAGMQKSRLESLEVYPVDATDHVQDKTLDVADPSQFNPSVSNVVAYARYGYSAMTGGKEIAQLIRRRSLRR